ncbi:hypothetical protein GR702_05700 [Novosphingobium sp. FGD1]|jgi:hypothetical protein|uniref:Uncharacterized protein n=1 Tax=Novosphingobium silvae TaxID=2692619 RepID=A0A7X4K5S3_9SPHN|nr:hypothetical protein [Novosphingobium silvae]MYL97266.1 hypothetical protein [Novosphingobium silvae]
MDIVFRVQRSHSRSGLRNVEPTGADRKPATLKTGNPPQFAQRATAGMYPTLDTACHITLKLRVFLG